jgi:hypothetical protein
MRCGSATRLRVLFLMTVAVGCAPGTPIEVTLRLGPGAEAPGRAAVLLNPSDADGRFIDAQWRALGGALAEPGAAVTVGFEVDIEAARVAVEGFALRGDVPVAHGAVTIPLASGVQSVEILLEAIPIASR